MKGTNPTIHVTMRLKQYNSSEESHKKNHHERRDFQFGLCGGKRVGRGIHERGMNTFLSKVKHYFPQETLVEIMINRHLPYYLILV